MKKLLLVLAIIAVTTPLMAQTVDFEVTDMTGGQVQIGYANNGVPAADLPVGIALKVVVSGCEITGLVSYDNAEFPAYIDYAYSEETGGDGYDPLGEGQPLAKEENTPGRLDTGVDLPATTVYVCMGRVQDGVEGPNPGPATVVNLVTLQLADVEPLDGVGYVSVYEDSSSRGGVVGGGDPFATDLPQEDVEIIIPGDGCYTGPDQAEWEAVGSPESWCADYQCHGDADDATQNVKIGRSYYDVRVSANDLGVLAACWQNTTVPDYSADFDHASQNVKIGRSYYDVRNSANDLAVLAFWWQNTTPPGDCQTQNPAPNQ